MVDRQLLEVRVQVLEGRPELPLPAYATTGSAGADLTAAEALWIEPGARVAVGTGLAFEIPQGFEAQVRPRSGLAIRHGITVLNSPGTIDSDYRGEVKVLLVNLGQQRFEVTVGQRIAQMVIAPVCQAEFRPVASLEDTVRGSGGFGHTGQ